MFTFLLQHEVYLQNAEQIGELVTLSGHTLDSLAQVDLHLEALWELVRFSLAAPLFQVRP